MEFGEKVKALRKMRGWTLDELADMTGLSKGYLSRLERGLKPETRESLHALAEVFSLPSSLLLHPTAPVDRLAEISEILEQIVQLSPEQVDAVSQMIRALRSSSTAG